MSERRTTVRRTLKSNLSLKSPLISGLSLALFGLGLMLGGIGYCGWFLTFERACLHVAFGIFWIVGGIVALSGFVLAPILTVLWSQSLPSFSTWELADEERQ